MWHAACLPHRRNKTTNTIMHHASKAGVALHSIHAGTFILWQIRTNLRVLDTHAIRVDNEPGTCNAPRLGRMNELQHGSNCLVTRAPLRPPASAVDTNARASSYAGAQERQNVNTLLLRTRLFITALFKLKELASNSQKRPGTH